MSVILKGIDLPQEGTLTFRITRYGKAYEITNDCYYIKGTETEAIQIPKGHGRLIDADETRTQYYQTMDELLQSTTINMSAEALSLLCGFTLINNAPTILEAEETDEFDIERD